MTTERTVFLSVYYFCLSVNSSEPFSHISTVLTAHLILYFINKTCRYYIILYLPWSALYISFLGKCYLLVFNRVFKELIAYIPRLFHCKQIPTLSAVVMTNRYIFWCWAKSLKNSPVTAKVLSLIFPKTNNGKAAFRGRRFAN